MSSLFERRFTRNIRGFVEAELLLAESCRHRGEAAEEFRHLQNAHVLGQRSVRLHVRTHCLMLCWAVHYRRPREVVGQLFRILGAATMTGFGLLPEGNTGGSDVSAFSPMPLSAEYAQIINTAAGTSKVFGE